MKHVVISLLLFGCFLTGCEENPRPPNLIEEDTYIDLLVELQLVKSYRESVPADSGVVDSLLKEVYKKYGISGEQFRISHIYYQEQYAEQKERVEQAIERLRMDKVESDSTRPWQQ